MNADPNPTTAWDGECVICGCKWLEADRGPLCPECEERKRDVDGNDQIGAIHAAIMAAFGCATITPPIDPQTRD